MQLTGNRPVPKHSAGDAFRLTLKEGAGDGNWIRVYKLPYRRVLCRHHERYKCPIVIIRVNKDC